MLLTTTAITLYDPTPTFTVFSAFPRHTPPEVDFRRATLKPLGLALLTVLLSLACFYLLFKKLQSRNCNHENANNSKLNEQRQTLRCRMILLQATNQLFSHEGVMNFRKAGSTGLDSGLSLDNRDRYTQVHAENTLNAFKTSASIPYLQSTLNANTEGLWNHNSALLAIPAIITTPRSASPVLI